MKAARKHTADLHADRLPGTEDLELGVLEEFIGPLLRRAYEQSFADFGTLLGHDTLWPGYFTMLTLIRNNPGITQVGIGRAAGRDKSQVTKALRHMEDSGLIRRIRVESDRRSYSSYLTEEGHALYARMEPKALIHNGHLLSVIGEERLELFIATLKDIIREIPPESEEG